MSLWTDARRFRVFLDVRKDIAGIDISDERFNRAVAIWARGWAAEIRRLGKAPDQFDLLLQDEPDTAEQASTTEVWARAIHQSGAGFRIWVDPVWQVPSMTPPSLIDAADTIAINLTLAEKAGRAYWEWARQLARAGKTVEIYGTSGPALRMDPYGYYRLTAWKAYFAGATAVSFWSFTDTGGGRSDHGFAAGQTNYSPVFIGDRFVRAGKHMEAAVEGIQDVQYLQMLKIVADTHARPDVRLRANELLEQASSFASKSGSGWDSQWKFRLESAEAERQRVGIGQFLDSLIP